MMVSAILRGMEEDVTSWRDMEEDVTSLRGT